jgi:hypothetical protein
VKDYLPDYISSIYGALRVFPQKLGNLALVVVHSFTYISPSTTLLVKIKKCLHICV